MNIIERFINIVVNNNQANANLKKTEDSLKKVDDNTKKATVSTRNYTDEVTKNGGAMAILNQLTGGLANNFKDAYESIQLSSSGLKGFGAALAATGIGLGVILIGALIQNWDKLKDIISQTSKETKILRDVQGDLTSKLKETYTELFRVKSAFEQARSGAISKKQALKEYNDTLGDTLGKAKSLEQAEKIYEEKTADYIRATQLRITSQLLLAKAAEESAKVATGENLDLSFWGKAGVAIKGYFNGVGDAISQTLANKTLESKDSINDLLKLAEKYQKEADKLSKSTGLNFNKTLTETNTLLAKQLEKIKEITAELLRQSNIIISSAEKTKETIEKKQSLGKIAEEYKDLSKTFLEVQKASTTYNNQLDELDKTYKKIQKPTEEQRKNYDNQRKSLENLINTYIDYTKDLNTLGNLIFDSANNENKSLQDKLILQNKINEINVKSIELQTKIFDFEKSILTFGDERLNNSNKFIEIEKNINDIYENRINLIEQTLGVEKKQADDKAQKAKEDLEKAQKDFEKASSEALDPNATDAVIAKALELKGVLLQAQINYNEANLEAEETSNELTLALLGQKADYELALEENNLQRKTLIREEELERERMFYNSVVGIAEEAQGFLSGLASCLF